MRKFAIPPDKASYSAAIGNSVISTGTANGGIRMRRDMFGAYNTVSVQWTCDPDGFQYVNSFYRTAVDEGSTPFLIGLIIDYADVTEYECYFVPGSLRLSSHVGLTYVMSAQLYVKPKELTQTDYDYVVIYENFGKNFSELEDILNTIINVKLPEYL